MVVRPQECGTGRAAVRAGVADDRGDKRRLRAVGHGMSFYVRSARTHGAYADGAWDIGRLRGLSVEIGGEQVVGPRTSAIADPDGGSQVDSEARAAIGAILTALRAHGLVAQ